MKRESDYYLRVIAIFLLIFLVFIGISVWLLDLVSQQRVFGFLASAELVAFALLVYIFYEQNPGVSKKILITGFVALGVLVLLAAAVLVGVGSAPKPNVTMTMYAKEISTTVYGFGISPTNVTSPGPTLTFKVGDVVNMTLINIGAMPHDWALVTVNQTSAPTLFNAQIASGTVPIQTNQTGNVIFKVTKAGDYYYICQVPGHVELGMWGQVVINP